MRKIIVISMITLDGVMQAPGGPEEDTSGGFMFGGWVAPFADEAYAKVVKKQMRPADYLLGRKTFEIWEDYWPNHDNNWPGINEGTKYVISKTRTATDWRNTVFLDNVEDIKALKNSQGSDIQVWGSAQLVQWLFGNNVVDELWLKIHPVILGHGKRLFANGALPTAFRLLETLITPSGVIMANYENAGDVKIGTVGSSEAS